MARTEVILIAQVPGLGAETDQIEVAAGYARNYLIPKGLAIPANIGNKKYLEALNKRRAEREATELNAMNELKKSLEKLVCLIKVKTGEEGKMYGSVTAATIADELKNQFDITLDRHKIDLEEPIRTLGEHEVNLRLHAQVKAKLKVLVESLTPLPEPEATEPETPDKGKGRKTEKARKGSSGKKTAKSK